MVENSIDELEAADNLEKGGSIIHMERMELNAGDWRSADAGLLREMPLTLFVDGKELVTIQCTPSKLNCLVVGFLHLERLISSIDDIGLLRVCEEDNVAEVRTNRGDVVFPARRTLTSGCGGGTALDADWESLPEVRSTFTLESGQVLSLSRGLQDAATLYRQSGGVHTSALADSTGLIAVAEDVGRHNTIDKIHGECLLTGISTRDRALFTTGRISSEMLTKAVKMAVPIVVSRSAPTDRSVQIAREKGITIIGYARGSRMSIYTHPWRVSDCPLG